MATDSGPHGTATASAAAKSFMDDGYSVIPGIIPTELMDDMRLEGLRLFEECQTLLAEKCLKIGIGAKEGYAEIVQRHEGRYEMRYGMEGALFSRPELLGNPVLANVLDHIFGGRQEYRLLAKSLVISMPGTATQTWHEDGGHLSKAEHLPPHCLNVFVPLVDLVEDVGPTELRPSSHFLTRDLAKMMLLAKARGKLRVPVSPPLRRGDALLFDYRTLHRGRENRSSAPRPVLVLTYARLWFNDVLNFPPRRLLQMAPADALVVSEGVKGVGNRGKEQSTAADVGGQVMDKEAIRVE